MSLLFFSRQKGNLLKTNFWSFSFLFFFQGTTYSYEWELITHPKDYSGEMEGKHSQTLKLSKVKLLLLGVLLYGMPSEENRNPGSQERLVWFHNEEEIARWASSQHFTTSPLLSPLEKGGCSGTRGRNGFQDLKAAYMPCVKLKRTQFNINKRLWMFLLPKHCSGLFRLEALC